MVIMKMGLLKVVSTVTAFRVQMLTMVVSVGLVKAFGVDEAQAVLLWWQGVQGGGAVRQVGHQGVVPIAHPHLTLERRQLLDDFSLVTLNQQSWRRFSTLVKTGSNILISAVKRLIASKIYIYCFYIIYVCVLFINIHVNIYMYIFILIYFIYKRNIFFINIFMHVCVFIFT